MPAPSSPQQRAPERLYFAFGSNMHLTQMAKRCPQSRYTGTAKLHNYQFQINQRGFANVIPSNGSYVEGLVYLLSPDDEASLDRSEGVAKACYQKYVLPIQGGNAGISERWSHGL